MSEWRQQAVCKGETQSFFAWGDEGPVRARQICQTCPVRTECLEEAMAHPAWLGVWGGLTAKERRDIRRSRVA